MYYLLAIIICGIVAIACFILGIIGIIKKKIGMFVTSVIVFVIACIVGVFIVFQFAVKTVDYVAQQDVQSTISQGAELAGKTAGSIISGGAKGLNQTLDDNAIAALAGKSATIVGKAIKATSSGWDSTFRPSIFIDASLANAGLELGRAEELYQAKSDDAFMSIFITFTKNCKGTLKLVMYDQEGKKMTIAQTEINEKAGAEKLIRFNFPVIHTELTRYYVLSKM
ncbi:MAG: hypothetical protein QM541_03885 [Flavobacterium sp.]|nr:hypothetical protein [Flavobacterium sp.]